MREINLSGRDHMRAFPKLRKTGAISRGGGECTPFVWKDRLMLLENLWEDPAPRAVVREYFSGKAFPPFGGDGARFYSACCENDVVFVFATLDNVVYRYTSADLVSWEKKAVLAFPDSFELFNTSVCKGPEGYMMAVECAWKGQSKGDGQNRVGNPYIGAYYTEFFASSPDLENWELLPFDTAYTPARYCACPALRWCEGYYYMICLESLPLGRYAPYIYRTKDFDAWEIGLYNPILWPSEEDRRVKAGVALPEELAKENAAHVDVNNSDVDLCEYEGKTYVVYCAGHQAQARGMNGLVCEAVYDGAMSEFLQAYFE
ncbi:MAG: hypothetical protein IJK89_01130 [Clostridia bacterium]|nr:hypothetical protein [Clostridia bacterium]